MNLEFKEKIYSVGGLVRSTGDIVFQSEAQLTAYVAMVTKVTCLDGQLTQGWGFAAIKADNQLRALGVTRTEMKSTLKELEDVVVLDSRGYRGWGTREDKKNLSINKVMAKLKAAEARVEPA